MANGRRNRYGGWTGIKSDAAGSFRTERIDTTAAGG